MAHGGNAQPIQMNEKR